MPVTPPQKILGILGGMGPAASAELCRLLAAKAPAVRDQEHPVMYMLSDPQIPGRVAGMDGKGEDPTNRMRKGLFTLAEWGADYLCVPCNTAHVFIDRFQDQIPKPFIHIVEATLAVSRIKSPEGSWLLATDGTCRSGLYQNYAKKAGYTYLEVEPAVQQMVETCMHEVKANKMREAGETMRQIVQTLQKIRDLPVTTACTELPLAYDASGLPPERNFSSLDALSDACLVALYGSEYMPLCK